MDAFRGRHSLYLLRFVHPYVHSQTDHSNTIRIRHVVGPKGVHKQSDLAHYFRISNLAVDANLIILVIVFLNKLKFSFLLPHFLDKN